MNTGPSSVGAAGGPATPSSVTGPASVGRPPSAATPSLPSATPPPAGGQPAAAAASSSGYVPMKAPRPITDLVFVVESTAVAGITMAEMRCAR